MRKFLIIILLASFNTFASCDYYYSKMTIKLEAAASASGRGDMCATADALEAALNFAGLATDACTGSKKADVDSWIGSLSAQLYTAVEHCGK